MAPSTNVNDLQGCDPSRKSGLGISKGARFRAFAAAQDWLTVFRLPPYAPHLNTVEFAWAVIREVIQANQAFEDTDSLERAVRHGLRHIQYSSDIIDGCLTATGLTTKTTRVQTQ
ncbi:transposase [Streptomyces sp. NBC_00063]|uniref:transposase n=1 Tax=Streptomyces sp. NBC_00063 TaxID=2975638 RepID=UPI003D753199